MDTVFSYDPERSGVDIGRAEIVPIQPSSIEHLLALCDGGLLPHRMQTVAYRSDAFLRLEYAPD